MAAALQAHASVIVTVPIAGYVAADKSGGGDVNKTPDYLNTRFNKSLPRKGAAFAYPPDTTDKVVYQDEFVAWLEKTFKQSPTNRQIFYSLDNEPDIWDSTHARLRTQKLTYAELLQRSIAFGGAIKAAAPGTLLFGPASFGWGGFSNLVGATDGKGRDFLDFYLAGMRDVEKTSGTRILDALDIHWYPEAKGGGKRITEGGNGDDVVRARLQAPRSLWDASYQEDSWITNDVIHKPINLLPRLRAQIKANYPGTKLAFTEYNYGGGNHISGAVAEADVLGIFGRDNVFAAVYWKPGAGRKFRVRRVRHVPQLRRQGWAFWRYIRSGADQRRGKEFRLCQRRQRASGPHGSRRHQQDRGHASCRTGDWLQNGLPHGASVRADGYGRAFPACECARCLACQQGHAVPGTDERHDPGAGTLTTSLLWSQ